MVIIIRIWIAWLFILSHAVITFLWACTVGWDCRCGALIVTVPLQTQLKMCLECVTCRRCCETCAINLYPTCVIKLCLCGIVADLCTHTHTHTHTPVLAIVSCLYWSPPCLYWSPPCLYLLCCVTTAVNALTWGVVCVCMRNGSH